MSDAAGSTGLAPAPRATLAVALGEYDTGWHDAAASLRGAADVVARAADAGARLVVLPEMATTGFTMDVRQAVPPESHDITALGDLARHHRVWMIAGVALRDGDEGERAVNAALVLDPRGEVVATYRKRRLFAYAGEHEHYAPGGEAVSVEIEGVRVAPFICYELRFPELFRAAADETDLMVLIANWPATRRLHWDVLVRARAIENQCWLVAVNRTGSGGGLDYDGGSAAYDPWGDPAPSLSSGGGPRVVTIDTARVAEVRGRYPFLKDRLTDATIVPRDAG